MANKETADRNLLLGILALQMDFITRDELVDALNAWAINKTKPLGELLVERGCLKSSNRSLLEPLVDAHAKEHGGADRSVANLVRDRRMNAALDSIADTDVRASLGGTSDRMSTPSHEETPRHDQGRPSSHDRSEAAKWTAPQRRDVAGNPCNSPSQPDHKAFDQDLELDAPAEFTSVVKMLVGNRTEYCFGPYRLFERLGGGGMGVVFRAEHAQLNRICALKMIKSGVLSSQAEVDRFKREAAAAARLDHPGIVPLYEIGVHEGQHFFAMGYVPGESLSRRLRSGPLEPRHAAELVRQAALAIDHAHQRMIIHRDLKPANILLEGDWSARTSLRPNASPVPGANRTPDSSPTPGSVKAPAARIADFGLAKRLDSSDGQLTQTGDVVGTPAYMSPEQAAGQRDVGRATDIYGLGAVLYHCLTGRPPFQAANPLQTVLQVLNAEPISIRQLDPSTPWDLETICHKCLQKDSNKRYASAADLALDLERFLNDVPIMARPIGGFERLWRWCRRNAVVASLLAAIAATLTLGICGAAWFAVDAARQARAAREASRSLQTAWQMIVGKRHDPIGLGPFDEIVPRHIGEARTIKENLQRALRMSNDLRSDPRLHASALAVIGNAYTSLGMREEAESTLRRALEAARSDDPIDRAVHGRIRRSLASLRMDSGRFADSALEFDAALREFAAAGLPPTHADVTDTLHLMAWLAIHDERYSDAAQFVSQIKDSLTQRGLPEHHFEMHRASMMELAIVLGQGSVLDAIAFAMKKSHSIGAFIDQLEDADLRAAYPHLMKAFLIQQAAVNSKQWLAKSSDAARELNACLDRLRASMGERVDFMAFGKMFLGDMLAAAGQSLEAEAAFKEGLKIISETNGLEHPHAALILDRYGDLLHGKGRGREIDPWYKKLIQARARQFGAEHFHVANAWVAYARLLQRRGETGQQRDACQRAMAIFKESGGPRRRYYAECLELLNDADKKLAARHN